MKILRPHQKYIVDYISKEGNKILLIHDTGTGKTLTAIASIFTILKTEKKDVLIIAPVSLIENWKREIIDYNEYVPANFMFLTFQAVGKFEIENICLNKIIVIDEVHNLRTQIKLFQLNTKRIKEYILKYKIKGFPINELNPDPGEKEKKLTPYLENLLDLHGIPRYLSYAPKVGKFAYYNLLCALNSYKLIAMTATPIINGHQDLNNLFKMFNENINNIQSISDVEGVIIKYKIPISYYFIDKNPNNGYPFYKIFNARVSMSETERIKYEKFEKNVKLTLTVMNDLRIKANTEVALDYYSPKIKYILNMLEQRYFKTLIYSFFVDKGMGPVYDMLINKSHLDKSEVFMITGKTPLDNRQKIVDAFNAIDKGVMIISSAGRDGINLKGVRYVFLLEPGWNDSSDYQALSRAVRFQSHTHLPLNEQKVDVFRLILNNTIDDYLYNKFVAPKIMISRKFMDLCKKYSI